MRILLIILFFFTFNSGVFCAEPLLDFGKFTTKVLETKQINSIIGEDGKTIKASRRDAKLLELKLEIIADVPGEFCLYPKMFSVQCSYRRVPMIIPAIALGTKISDKMTGETKEYWYTDPEVSIILEVSGGERFYKYLIIEIPKKVETFQLLGPAVIQEVNF